MTAHAPVPSHCRNCQAMLRSEPAPLYCWRCGQETQLHEPTFLEFVHEFIGHYVAVEGPLWRTLLALVFSPGRLTAEYFAGRRRRYVLPLRLYLTASFVFFLVVKVFGAADGLQVVVAPFDSHGRPVTASANPAEYQATLGQMRACVDVPASCSWLSTLNARAGLKADALASHPDVLAGRLVALAPYAVFALLPLFAAIVMLVYRSRRLNYGGHFVFSLHSHAFWFLALTVLALLPGPALVVGLVILPLHAVLSLHRVHGGGWLQTLARSVVIALLYVLALVVALIVLSLGSVLTG